MNQCTCPSDPSFEGLNHLIIVKYMFPAIIRNSNLLGFLETSKLLYII